MAWRARAHDIEEQCRIGAIGMPVDHLPGRLDRARLSRSIAKAQMRVGILCNCRLLALDLAPSHLAAVIPVQPQDEVEIAQRDIPLAAAGGAACAVHGAITASA